MAVFWSVRPCGYCLTLVSILFLTTSPSSPFAPSETSASLGGSPGAGGGEPGESWRLTDPVAGRSWLDMNKGRIMDPVLMGYKHFSSLSEPAPSGSGSGGSSSEAGAGAHGGPSWKFWRGSSGADDRGSDGDGVGAGTGDRERTARLPRGYVDLSFRGIGFVFDFNPTRTEDGIAWEIEDARRARAKSTLPPASTSTSTGEGEKTERSVGLTEPAAASGWARVPFLGSW